MIHTDRTVVPHAVSEQSLATLEPSATVVEAARMMAYLRIGALMVVDGEKLVGIFSERDALTRVVAKERDPATTRVSASEISIAVLENGPTCVTCPRTPCASAIG